LKQPQVWVAVVFVSDGSITYAESAYVDNVVLHRYAGLAPAPGEPSPPVLPPGMAAKEMALSLHR
jgi:hypothetical protein